MQISGRLELCGHVVLASDSVHFWSSEFKISINCPGIEAEEILLYVIMKGKAKLEDTRFRLHYPQNVIVSRFSKMWFSENVKVEKNGGILAFQQKQRKGDS